MGFKILKCNLYCFWLFGVVEQNVLCGILKTAAEQGHALAGNIKANKVFEESFPFSFADSKMCQFALT